MFQIILLANVARSMAKAGPMTSVDDVINANVVEGSGIIDGTGLIGETVRGASHGDAGVEP